MPQPDESSGVASALVRSAFLVDAVYAESAREYGLTPQQGQLLCVLMPQPYGMSELGMILRLARSSLTELVDRSVKRGLVRREPSPTDRRAVQVTLTEAGAALADTFYRATVARVDGLSTGLSGGERDTLGALLGRLVRENKVPLVFQETTQH
ncbi:MAG: MarR family winged helix-turn-helix transcriptional regulator [Actinomycetes bacterium]